MATKTKLTLRKGYQKKDGTCAIYLNIFIGRKVHSMNLKESIDPRFWIEEKDLDKVKREHPRDKALNMKLNKAKRTMDDIVDRLELQGVTITYDLLKKAYHGGSTDCFYSFAEEEINRRFRMKEIAYDTHRCQLNRLNRIREFSPQLAFNQITKDFLNKLLEWLMFQEGNNRNTANMKLKLIKTYIRIARERDLTDNDPFKSIRFQHEPTEKEILEPDEVQKLNAFLDSGELPSRLHNVLHYFLIACYTGFRFSDYAKFNLYKGEDTFRIMMSKTKSHVAVPIVPRAKELLLGQYHILSNTKTNQYLKEVMKIAGIDKQITTHSARHTFAINLLRRGGCTLKDLQTLLGHKDYKSTLIYAKYVPESQLEKVMSGFDY
ncbi:site-specific integrase [Algivirga pacifica]|uniref:Site-specific integrase n=1 Tax=Algivirga pacifica TaxID=1162670 RepID=A0ABP9DFV5_9BACT